MPDTTRVSRVKRVTNPEKSDWWVDVAVIYQLIVEFGAERNYEKRIFTFDHSEDNQNRKTHKLKIKLPSDPDADPNDPEPFVEIDVIDQLEVEFGEGFNYQKSIVKFDNDKANDNRKFRSRTIFHYELSQAPGDGKTKEDMMSAQDYLDALLILPDDADNGPSPDKGQSLEIEVDEQFDTEFGGGFNYLKSAFHLDPDKDPLLQDPLKAG